MKKKNKKGFSRLVVALIILTIGSLGFVTWKAMSNDSASKQSAPDVIQEAITLKLINQGPAMEPAIADGQEIQGHLTRPTAVKRGDIIVFKPSISDAERMVKRVVGLPGDMVAVDGGEITVTTRDGSTYRPGLNGAPPLQKISKVVSENSFFVVGDNLGNSLDSRAEEFGLVSYDNLIGVIEL